MSSSKVKVLYIKLIKKKNNLVRINIAWTVCGYVKPVYCVYKPVFIAGKPRNCTKFNIIRRVLFEEKWNFTGFFSQSNIYRAIENVYNDGLYILRPYDSVKFWKLMAGLFQHHNLKTYYIWNTFGMYIAYISPKGKKINACFIVFGYMYTVYTHLHSNIYCLF